MPALEGREHIDALEDEDDDDATSNDPELVPCLAHVFQLALGDFYNCLNIRPTNDELITVFDERESKRSIEGVRRENRVNGIPFVLAKVSTEILVKAKLANFDRFAEV